MGATAFSQMKEKERVSRSVSANRFVDCVARKIISVLDDPELRNAKWEVVVFDSDQINAFALPGQKIGVYTGILAVTENADQLGAVLGHEVGHVLAHHGNERVSQSFIAQGGLAAAQAALGNSGSKENGLLLAGLGLGLQVGGLMPFGRTQESEADLIGLRLMARAGFNPNESVKLWQNMQAKGGSGPPEFLSTHPTHSTRINDLNSNIPSVMADYQQAAKANCPR